MNQKEKILSKHFQKEYGFEIPKNKIKGFKYILDAMEEYAQEMKKGG